jgi:hypothetical protein
MNNLDKIKESKKDYYLKNTDKINSQKVYSTKKQVIIKEYCEKNRDKIKESQRDFFMKNDYSKKYEIKNLDKIKERKKEYYKNKIKDKVREIRTQKNPNYIPYYSWKSREQSRKNFDSIASLLHITDLSDWYRISSNQIQQLGGKIINSK